MLATTDRETVLARFDVSLSPEFLSDEVDYLLGRYMPQERDRYLTQRRDGRGTTPRVNQALRARILSAVVAPYENGKNERNALDWNDLAIAMASAQPSKLYDIIIVDEAQDFSAQQARAVMRHAAPNHATTFVLDAAQRIYPRFFTWSGAGITITPRDDLPPSES